MPPITASACCNRATRRCVMSKRFNTFAWSRRTGWLAVNDVVKDMARPLCREDFAAREQGREDETAGCLGGGGLGDAAIDDEFQLVVPRDHRVLYVQRLQHRAHGMCHQRLAD